MRERKLLQSPRISSKVHLRLELRRGDRPELSEKSGSGSGLYLPDSLSENGPHSNRLIGLDATQ